MIRTIVTCDAVHPERTPPECRAFMTIPRGWPYWFYTANHDWMQVGDRWLCPSCARAYLAACEQHPQRWMQGLPS
jgi:rubredoxin